MSTGKYFPRCKGCATEWYDSRRRPSYCSSCLSLRRERRTPSARKEEARKGAATRQLNNLMHRYGSRIKTGKGV